MVLYVLSSITSRIGIAEPGPEKTMYKTCKQYDKGKDQYAIREEKNEKNRNNEITLSEEFIAAYTISDWSKLYGR